MTRAPKTRAPKTAKNSVNKTFASALKPSTWTQENFALIGKRGRRTVWLCSVGYSDGAFRWRSNERPMLIPSVAHAKAVVADARKKSFAPLDIHIVKITTTSIEALEIVG